jgi:hypothetical protein
VIQELPNLEIEYYELEEFKRNWKVDKATI